MTVSKLIATFCGIGMMRPAPGTWGSLAALPVAYIWVALIGAPFFAVSIVVLYYVGLWATTQETAGQADHDPSEIVIDEVVGQWIALLPVIIGAFYMKTTLLALWPGWIAAFVLFRLFDITKPWHVGHADARDDATGVMLDDVIAGIYAAICVVILAAIYHIGWM